MRSVLGVSRRSVVVIHALSYLVYRPRGHCHRLTTLATKMPKSLRGPSAMISSRSAMVGYSSGEEEEDTVSRWVVGSRESRKRRGEERGRPDSLFSYPSLVPPLPPLSPLSPLSASCTST